MSYEEDCERSNVCLLQVMRNSTEFLLVRPRFDNVVPILRSYCFPLRHIWLSPCSIGFLQKLIATYTVKEFPGRLSKEPTIGPVLNKMVPFIRLHPVSLRFILINNILLRR